MRAKYDMEMQFVIEGSDGWSEGTKLDQVFKQAQDDADNYYVYIKRGMSVDDVKTFAGLGLKLVNKKLKVKNVKVSNDD